MDKTTTDADTHTLDKTNWYVVPEFFEYNKRIYRRDAIASIEHIEPPAEAGTVPFARLLVNGGVFALYETHFSIAQDGRLLWDRSIGKPL